MRNTPQMSIGDVQRRIDQLVYPPTHTYDLATMTPSGVLANRAAIIAKYAPKFFSGDKFLDIGASKGFFTFSNVDNFNRIVCVDPNEDCTQLCRDIRKVLKYKNVRVIQGGIDAVPSEQKFDRIFMGNVHHYVFIQHQGWDWIEKLYELSTDQILIEGPQGMECKDMMKCIPEDLRSEFNMHKMLKAMENKFSLEWSVPTVAYTPKRHFMLFKRLP